MGRIKTALLKSTTRELMEKHGEKLTGDFEHNKKIVENNVQLSSKKLRNIVAGYAARLKKAEKY